MFTAGFAGDHAIRTVWEMTSYVSVSSSFVQQWIHIYVSLQKPGFLQPLLSGSHVRYLVFAWEVQDLDFREMTSGIIRVFCTLWFDSGYMLASVLRLGRISHIFYVWWTPGDDFMFVSVFSAELGLTADTCSASVYGAF